MAERMVEVIAFRDTIDGSLHNIRLTDERIVRCRDCKHSWKDGTLCNFWITLDSFENPVPSDVEPDGFCKWGEPRGER